MDTLEKLLSLKVKAHLKEAFKLHVEKTEFQLTRTDFEGDITLMLFPLLKLTRQKPSVLGESIGSYLVEKNSFVTDKEWKDYLLDYSDHSFYRAKERF